MLYSLFWVVLSFLNISQIIFGTAVLFTICSLIIFCSIFHFWLLIPLKFNRLVTMFLNLFHVEFSYPQIIIISFLLNKSYIYIFISSQLQLILCFIYGAHKHLVFAWLLIFKIFVSMFYIQGYLLYSFIGIGGKALHPYFGCSFLKLIRFKFPVSQF